MFGLFSFNKTPHGEALLKGVTDIHCHLLPGVDDGMDVLMNSFALLAKEQMAGVKRIYFTPHSMSVDGSVVDAKSYGAHYHSHSGNHASGVHKGYTHAATPLEKDFSTRFEGILPSDYEVSRQQEEYTAFESGIGAEFSQERLGGYSNAHLKAKFEIFRKFYKGDIDIRLAAEYMMNKGLLEKVKNHDMLTYSDGRHILVETSYFAPPIDMDTILYEIEVEGYSPILAHPERYEYMGPEDYARLHQRGVEFQLNYLSLTGYYGKRVYAKAIDLLEKGWYTYTGSDFHRLTTFYHQIGKLLPQKKHAALLQGLFENNSSL